MRERRRIAVVACALVFVAVVVLGIGANPRYLEELRIGGGYGDPVDGGADFEKDGDIYTDGDVTLNSDTTVGDNYAADVVRFNSQVDDLGNNEPSHLFRAVNPKSYAINGDCEVWLDGDSTYPTGWAHVGDVVTTAKETTIVKRGKASMHITGQLAEGELVLNRGMTSTGALNGRTVTFGAWVYTSIPANTAIGIKNGSSYYYKYATLTNTWEWVGITANITNDAFSVRVLIGANDPVVEAYFDGMILVEGPEEWGFAPGDDRLGYISVSPGEWFNFTDNAQIYMDPDLVNGSIRWQDADADWIVASVVIPEDYDADIDDAWFVGYYSLDAGQDNVTLDLKTRVQKIGSVEDASDTDYNHTSVYHGSNDQNVDRAVYKINETMVGGDVLLPKTVRADDGVDTAGLRFWGGQLVYVKR